MVAQDMLLTVLCPAEPVLKAPVTVDADMTSKPAAIACESLCMSP
jgi:hypothetical protein